MVVKRPHLRQRRLTQLKSRQNLERRSRYRQMRQRQRKPPLSFHRRSRHRRRRPPPLPLRQSHRQLLPLQPPPPPLSPLSSSQQVVLSIIDRHTDAGFDEKHFRKAIGMQWSCQQSSHGLSNILHQPTHCVHRQAYVWQCWRFM